MPPVVPIPGIKLGLSNAVTLTAIYLLGKRDAGIILFLRILLGSLFAGNISSLIFSLCGGTLCYIIMCLLSKMPKDKIWVVSIFGAVAHNMGQILAAIFVMKSIAVLWYFPYLLISAVITGLFTGILSQLTFKKIKGKV